jgi:hypothetical protein
MHDGINRAQPEHLVKVIAIRQFAYDQLGALGHRFAMAATQVVEDDNLVS